LDVKQRESRMSETNEPMTIDVVSDVVCPWCYLGKKRLEAAIAESGGETIAVRWRPYQLDPTIPEGGLDRAAYMRKKFGDDSRLESVHARLKSLGDDVGIAFAFDKIKRAPNTLDAHRLIHWALSAGVQGEVVDRLFKLYFEEGKDIGDRALLIAVAGECGMDVDLVRKLLDEGSDVDVVEAEIAEAQSLGVSGVPFFVFASRYAVPGAQETAVLGAAIERARQAMAGVEVA
jgi:predicted DsbA family dithiol-disulfide isomerase